LDIEVHEYEKMYCKKMYKTINNKEYSFRIWQIQQKPKMTLKDLDKAMQTIRSHKDDPYNDVTEQMTIWIK
jgi:hypothetical protein